MSGAGFQPGDLIGALAGSAARLTVDVGIADPTSTSAASPTMGRSLVVEITSRDMSFVRADYHYEHEYRLGRTSHQNADLGSAVAKCLIPTTTRKASLATTLEASKFKFGNSYLKLG